MASPLPSSVSIGLPTSNDPEPPLSLLGKLGVVYRSVRHFRKFIFDKPAYTRPQGQIPVLPITPASLGAAPNRTLWRLGHSSVLMKLQGSLILIDPVFANRASPVAFAGPRRFHAPPISVRQLPPIKAVILSHDHYDHLDKRAIRRLARKTEFFIAPRGVGDHLRKWGVAAAKIRELEWWQETEIPTWSDPKSEGSKPAGAAGSIRLACTPTQHFSGRSLFNRNHTLFCSWVIVDNGLRVFYGADSGYFPGFRTIGEKYGPFDVTLIENGAYNLRWPTIHMQPEETAQVHLDLRGRWLIPIHHGTFDLALHPWTEPMDRLQALATRLNIQLVTPRFGEPVQLDNPHPGTPWWRSVDPHYYQEIAHLKPERLRPEQEPAH